MTSGILRTREKMETSYPLNELKRTLKAFSFADWLRMEEPCFFTSPECKVNYLPLLIATNELKAWSSVVSIINVDGHFYKLDGADKKKHWCNESNKAPDTVFALVYDISLTSFELLIAESEKLAFHSLSHAEQAKAVYSELGLSFTSERIRNGMIYESINIALRGRQRTLQDKRTAREKEEINIKKAIEFFKDDLIFIDQLVAKPDIFLTGVLAGSLLMLALKKPNTKLFLAKLNSGMGQVLDGKKDPVESLLKIISRHRIAQRYHDPKTAVELCQKTVHAILSWEEGAQSPSYWRERDPKGTELTPIIREMKNINKINAQMDL